VLIHRSVLCSSFRTSAAHTLFAALRTIYAATMRDRILLAHASRTGPHITRPLHSLWHLGLSVTTVWQVEQLRDIPPVGLSGRHPPGQLIWADRIICSVDNLIGHTKLQANKPTWWRRRYVRRQQWNLLLAKIPTASIARSFDRRVRSRGACFCHN
jgi:hypothetical protein